MITASVLWLPSGLRNYAMRVLPESQKAELGDALCAGAKAAGVAVVDDPKLN